MPSTGLKEIPKVCCGSTAVLSIRSLRCSMNGEANRYECKPIPTCIRGTDATSGGAVRSGQRSCKAWEDAFSRGGDDVVGITQTLHWEKDIQRLHKLHCDTYPVLWRYTAGKSCKP